VTTFFFQADRIVAQPSINHFGLFLQYLWQACCAVPFSASGFLVGSPGHGLTSNANSTVYAENKKAPKVLDFLVCQARLPFKAENPKL